MSTRQKVVALVLGSLLILAVGIVLPTLAHDQAGLAKLGKVTFPVSCNAAAQKEFEIAMAYYHSFAWPENKAALERVLTGGPELRHGALGPRAGRCSTTPSCGRAVSRRRFWATARRPSTRPGRRGSRPRARSDYVEALAVFFKDSDKLNHRTRAKAFETAMLEVATRYPSDTEATILYALVLSANFDPADKKYTNQLRAAQHAGADLRQAAGSSGRRALPDPQLRLPAHRAAGARRRQALLEDRARRDPRAAHALAHLHARRLLAGLGGVQPAVGAGSTATRHLNSPHAYDYMVYAQLQLGQDRAAAEVLAHARGVAHQGRPHRRGVRVRGDAGAHRARARGLGGRGKADARSGRRGLSVEEVSAVGSGERVRPGRRRGHERRRRGGPGRGRASAGAARHRRRAEDRLLGRADRHPGRGRARTGQLRRRQVRRVRGDAAGRRRPRGRHREARRHAGTDRAGPRGPGGGPSQGRQGRRGAARSSSRC